MFSKKYRLSYLPLFYKDLDEKVTYIAEKLKNPKAANDLLDKVESAIMEKETISAQMSADMVSLLTGRLINDLPYGIRREIIFPGQFLRRASGLISGSYLLISLFIISSGAGGFSPGFLLLDIWNIERFPGDILLQLL